MIMTLSAELQGTYILLEEIGSGGGGTVFKAYHKRLEKEVVLKKIHSNLVGGNITAERDILKNLKSEYLPQVLDFFVLDGDVYTVMEFIPGRSLKTYLRDGQRFKQNQVLKWLDQLCSAVEKLHEQTPPIIHGDIKPDNIMLTPEGNICLIDFNVSGDFENTDVTGITPGYASPEQVSSFNMVKARRRGERAGRNPETAEPADGEPDFVTEVDSEITVLDDSEATELEPAGTTELDGAETAESGGVTKETPKITVDARSDIYSIGATVYHLLTGDKPGVEHVKPIWEYSIKLEDAFAFLIMKCLEREPDKRYRSVAELHKEVRSVHRKGAQFRALLRRQFLVRLLLAAGVIGFAGLAAAGRTRIGAEKLEKYHEIVNMEQQAREQGNYEEVLKRFEDAAAIFPEKGEAYLELLRSLYRQKRYEESADYMENEIIYRVTESDFMGEIYFVYGNSCLELERYSAAADAFSKAVYFDSTNSAYHQDYAIALARLGRTDEASERLDQAVRYGLGNDAVYYTRGEIAWAGKDYTAAWDDFYNCISLTDDDYRKMRAYLMCSQILGQQEQTEEIMAADIALLEEAVRNVDREYSNALLERLAQAYIDMGEISGNTSYDLQAVAVFEKIADYGWATYTTYQNMAILYQKDGMYEEGLTLLETMLQLFGENYNTYKRMAFMEASRQSQAEAAVRDYGRFAEYYERAVNLYEEQLAGNQTDAEMFTLQNLYDQAVQGGWIG